MASHLPGYEYDVFISYRQNDNRSGWVTEFVKMLEDELSATFKYPVSVYFDSNPHHGLQDTHDVDGSLEEKVKCLVFVPIVSHTYGDTKSFAWNKELLPFLEFARNEDHGLKIKLPNGNVTSRVLPVRIHDLDKNDTALFEQTTGGVMRSVDFVYRAGGVNRPLLPTDKREDNINKTFYLDQVNKLANAIKEILDALAQPVPAETAPQSPAVEEEPVTQPKSGGFNWKRAAIVGMFTLLAGLLVYFISGPENTPVKEEVRVAVPTEVKLAVMPFENLSADPDQDYFADGTTGQLIQNLSRLRKLSVIGHATMKYYRNTDKNALDIGKELGATHILSAGIQKYGDKIRVNTELLETATGLQVWGETYDRDFADLIQLQDDLTASIAGPLLGALTREELDDTRTRGTDNAGAYDLYLQARYVSEVDFWQGSFTRKEFDRAQGLFNQVIAMDSGFARAHAGLANLLGIFYLNIDKSATLKSEMLQAIEKAERLAPDDDYVLAVTAYVYSVTERPIEGWGLAKKAVMQNPGEVFNWWILAYIETFELGLQDNAIEHLKHILKEDPYSEHGLAGLAATYLHTGDFEKAANYAERGLHIYPMAFWLMVDMYIISINTNDLEQAEEWLKKLESINPASDIYLTNYKAMLLAKKGDKKGALELRPEQSYVFIVLEMYDEAFERLYRFHEENDRSIYMRLKYDPVYAPVRSDPRYPDLLEKERIKYEALLEKCSVSMEELLGE
ncbi:MAG: hypothetical protein OEX02_05690 [Cyclobacteriaceae bacterium]|nr:hypothetical protein [Cyclobacteriaceae bacterium]